MSGAEDHSSSAVERALNILEAIAERGSGLTNAELSRKLKIPKSSASYILRALERRGYLRRERLSGKYRLGLKVVSLSRGVLSGVDIRELARPVMRQLVERCQLTSHLAVLDEGRAVYVDKVEAPGFIKMDTWVGRRMEAHATAVGKSLLAHLPVGEVDAIIKQHGLTKRTSKTIASRAPLLRELERVRLHGYAVDDEENNLGARCVAAPIFDNLGDVVASVGVSGTSGQVNKSTIPKMVEWVKEAARKISQQLGR